MTTTEQGVWVRGKRTSDAGDLRSALSTARAFEGGFVWVGLADAGDDEILDRTDALDLPHLAVEDTLRVGRQRPKVEVYGDTVFLVVKKASYDDAREQVRLSETALFLRDGLVVVVDRAEGAGGEGSLLEEVRGSLQRQPGLLGLGAASVVHAVLDRTVDGYVPVLQGLEDDVDQVEESVFSPVRTDDTQRVYLLKRQVLHLRRSVLPLREVLSRLAGGSVPHVPEELLPYFRDVHDHVVRDAERVEALERLLDGLLDATVAKVGQQENADQRKISAWAAMGLVPTVLAGIFGMNFSTIPGTGLRFGFVLLVVVMVAVSALLHRGFRRNGWL